MHIDAKRTTMQSFVGKGLNPDLNLLENLNPTA